MLVAAQSKERELKLKERAVRLETNENSLRETHTVVEHRLGLSESKMSDMLTQLKTSKTNVVVLEKQQEQHTGDIARYQLYISELEIQKDTYYNNYNQLLTEVEEKETKRRLSHQEEEKEKNNVHYLQQQHQLLSTQYNNEQMLYMQAKATIIEQEDQISALESKVRQTARKGQEVHSRDQARKKVQTLVQTLVTEKEEIEKLLVHSNKREEHMQQENLVLATESRLMQDDLRTAQTAQRNLEHELEHQRRTVEESKRQAMLNQQHQQHQQQMLLEYNNKITVLERKIIESKLLLKTTKDHLNRLHKQCKLENEERLVEREQSRTTIEHLLDEKEECHRKCNVLIRQLDQKDDQKDEKEKELVQLLTETTEKGQAEQRKTSQELLQLQAQLQNMTSMKRSSDEQTMKMRRELDMRSSELDLESSMRNELDGIRADFKSFLSQSKQVVVGSGGGGSSGGGSSGSGSGSGSGSSSSYINSGDGGYSSGSVGSRMLRTPLPHGISNSGGSGGSGGSGRRFNYSNASSSDFGRTTMEILADSPNHTPFNRDRVEGKVDEAVVVSGESGESADDGSTSITISRRGSIRVHTNPTTI